MRGHPEVAHAGASIQKFAGVAGLCSIALFVLTASCSVDRAVGASRTAAPTVSTTLTSATITIQTEVPTRANLSLSSDRSLALTVLDGLKTSHRITVHGLRPATTYNFRLRTMPVGGVETTQAAATFSTATYGATAASATVSGKNVLINGSPFFAIVSYLHFVPGVFNETCPTPQIIKSNVAAGVELLIGQTSRCDESDLPTAISKLHSVLDQGLWWAEDSQHGSYKGMDTELAPLPEHLADWSSLLYSGTLIGGPGIWECSGNGHGAVRPAKAYSQIVTLAKTGPVEYAAGCLDAVHTPNETWLGIIAGARILVFYDDRASGLDAAGFTPQLDKIATLAPAFLNGRGIPLRASSPSIRAAAWSFGGVNYVAAANITGRSVRASLGGLLASTSADALWENRRVRVKNGSLVDGFRPFEVHLYKVLPPSSS